MPAENQIPIPIEYGKQFSNSDEDEGPIPNGVPNVLVAQSDLNDRNCEVGIRLGGQGYTSIVSKPVSDQGGPPEGGNQHGLEIRKMLPECVELHPGINAENLGQPTERQCGDQGRLDQLDHDRQSGEGSMWDLNAEVEVLKSKVAQRKSALIHWGGQSRQVFFEETQAIPTITKKIKNAWGMKRMFYWLSINGVHEEQVTSWPLNSSVEVSIRGLGAGPSGAYDRFEEKGKFPKGRVRICVGGRIFKPMSNKTFYQLCELAKIEFCGDEIWLASGKNAPADHKLRYYFPPDPEGLQFVDEVLDTDPLRLRRQLGMVNLSLDGDTFTVANNQ
jgi:hypothetical protein